MTDPLRPFRGILLGLALSVPFWGLVALLAVA
jgi:hypothetical protein